MLSALLAGVLCAFARPADARDRDGRHDERNCHDRSHHHPPDPAMIQARQKFFGIENVDERGNLGRDKVLISWASNTTYVVSAAGHVLLMDSYINRPELPTTPIDKRRTPILPHDFVDVRPEAIFL